MLRNFLAWLGVLVLVNAGLASRLAAAQQSEAVAADLPSAAERVMVIEIEGEISKPQLYILRRGLKEAIEGDFSGVILDMNTPGGSVAVTLEIMKALDRYPGRKITYVNQEAVSAGAIIAAVTDDIYFAPSGIIGAAEVVQAGQDVPESMKRKLNSYLRAKVSALSRDYPGRANVIRAMVEPDFELKIGDEVIKPAGELLSLTADEALAEYGDPPRPLLASGIAASVQALASEVFGNAVQIQMMEITWSEELARFLTTLSPLLLAAGMVLLFVEFKTPGFGFFGIAGGVLLAIVFFGHYAAGLSGHEPALFFVIGLALIAVEVFVVPGALVFGIAGGALALGSLVWAMADLWPRESVEFSSAVFLSPLIHVMLGVTLALLIMLALLRFLPKGGLWGRLVLTAAVGGESHGPIALPGSGATASLSALVGQEGVALTPLVPSGQVEIAGKRYEARLDVGFADAGARVKCVAVSEFSIRVEPI